MANLTRDPNHALAGSIYCNNVNDLVIKVNGSQVESQLVKHAYVNAVNGPYVVLFQWDESGEKFVLDSLQQPVTVKIEGEVAIEGKRTTCGCWAGRRGNKRWWKRVESGVRGY